MVAYYVRRKTGWKGDIMSSEHLDIHSLSRLLRGPVIGSVKYKRCMKDDSRQLAGYITGKRYNVRTKTL